MGILTQIKEPVLRDPVVLYQDLSFIRSLDECKGETKISHLVAAIPEVIAVNNIGDNPPCEGSEVFILVQGNGQLGVWISDPIPRCLGQVADSQSSAVMAICGALASGLKGTTVNYPETAQQVFFVRLKKESEQWTSESSSL